MIIILLAVMSNKSIRIMARVDSTSSFTYFNNIFESHSLIYLVTNTKHKIFGNELKLDLNDQSYFSDE